MMDKIHIVKNLFFYTILKKYCFIFKNSLKNQSIYNLNYFILSKMKLNAYYYIIIAS